MKLSKNQISLIVLAIVSILAVAGLGSLFVNLGMNWFDATTKPSQWIPTAIIPIVWSIIYLSAAIIISIWIKRDGKLPKSTTILFIINGILNVLWCLTFFTLQQTFLGNIVIIINLIAAIVLWLNIFKREKIYSYFLALYPLWLAIATTLNLAIWILN
ncbi:MAG: tryptophan-rich sensory protein [Clostridia bacterium]|nr:tryptophan-rich sensory protein [Clostridia bacterium]